MSFTIKISAFSLFAFALAACGGGSTSNGGGGGSGTFAFDNKAALEELQAETDFTFTDAGDLPTNGTASYEGFVQIANTSDAVPAIQGAEAVGVATFEATFGANPDFTGSATDFQDAMGTYDGTLTISNGSIAADSVSPGATIATGDIAGMLTRESGEEISIAGAVEGRFFGANGAHLVGSTNQATATVDGTEAGIEIAIHGARQ